MDLAPPRCLSLLLALGAAALGCRSEAAVQAAVAKAPALRASASAAAPRSSAELAPPAAPPEPPDPDALRFFLDHLSEPAVTPSREAPPGVAAIALANTALGEAAGLTPEGPLVFASLSPGQRLTIPVTLPPGRCATFLAQGGLGVIEIDLFLTTPAQGAVPSFLADEVAAGPIAVIGGRRGCMKAPAGAPSALELHAVLRRGAGNVLVQAFARDTSR
jgi:hypothetical protein